MPDECRQNARKTQPLDRRGRRPYYVAHLDGVVRVIVRSRPAGLVRVDVMVGDELGLSRWFSCPDSAASAVELMVSAVGECLRARGVRR